MRNKILIAIVAIILIGAGIYLVLVHTNKGPLWIIDKITYKTKDGLELEAWFLRPKEIKGTYPAIACFHHAWGNRDDFLKLFPYFAEAGIMAISPNLPRGTPTFNPRRYLDLIDTLDYLETLSFIDKKRLGIVTSSLSVNTGALAITGKPNVIADVMLSGPIMMEETRKWLTINSNLALFIAVSKYETLNYQLMLEYYARSLNPLTKAYFIDNKEKKFVVEYHGTYLLDTYPETVPMIQQFMMDVFKIPKKTNGYLKKPLPDNIVNTISTDGLPVFATFAVPKDKKSDIPAVVLYPPRYHSRTYYDSLVNILLSKGFAVLAPNNKRTCRYKDKESEFLCDREIKGALKFLRSQKKIDKNRIAIVFPSAYFPVAKYMYINNQLKTKKVIFVQNGDMDYGIKPLEIKKDPDKIIYIKTPNFDKLVSIIEKKI